MADYEQYTGPGWIARQVASLVLAGRSRHMGRQGSSVQDIKLGSYLYIYIYIYISPSSTPSSLFEIPSLFLDSTLLSLRFLRPPLLSFFFLFLAPISARLLAASHSFFYVQADDLLPCP
ncbi:hypothetical protein SODALDRAFT_180124 [Sodiomyces alkalinus F11]|uniref:Uncharacterized protein n=1 Tax=Sodiomyces alkalinus (strain CBS 110278 / VKM F-3762 / F11) TaxID=1314773 RepID=A0A3N2PU50_SODAK|nr:hypothetical protein SODALDRAFT_180124 [Sodiomyces alkalinus F11]ROT38043.1 hypothetical protein SODALDRAFT_180124 [Sodiomyces alkalinus F11]